MDRISRRTVLAVATASAATSVISGGLIGRALAQTAVTRYNAYTAEGKRMLGLYATGVRVMKARSGTNGVGDPTGWSFWWYTHWVPGPRDNVEKDRIIATLPASQRRTAQIMWNDCLNHNPATSTADQSFFLPWHRMYIYFFEQMVRAACGDPSFTLPYWNYLGSGQGALPPEFLDRSSPLYETNRDPASNAGQPRTAGVDYSCLLNPYFHRVNAPNMSNLLNNNPHGAIHDNIGNSTGMGNVPYAARDPIFFLHHSNVDRLWASWNRAGYQNPDNDTHWTDRSFEMVSTNGSLVSRKVGEFSSIAPLGYTYQEFEPVAPASAKLTASAEPATPTLVTAVAALGRLGERKKAKLKSAAGQGLKALAAANYYYLKLGGLSADAATETNYGVYLAPANDANPTADKYLVGHVSFFDVAGARPMKGMTHPPEDIYFDVTTLVKALGTADLSQLAITVTADGTAAKGSNAAIASVSLYKA
jgi:tyrosinase